ncbi:hypothetical protein LKD70_09040 [Ruminococcus sp. CLA-AA-H200]|uniref:Uncharacterized protein n=1 Tax=Ruminococcus turbiniformis TaxID=2881258 RepID=A0ABS8FYA0_9FIRM|nr:hypothetical protein [Ruminococcus turbiniformis]MCC2254559.1 hypothetical protein [Ruminococcus turbiniformis]
MVHITDRFVLFVFDHPTEDILNLFNRFVRSLTEDELKELEIPTLLETGKCARDATELMKQAILDDIREREQESHAATGTGPK